jgi:hypothetical protein
VYVLNVYTPASPLEGPALITTFAGMPVPAIRPFNTIGPFTTSVTVIVLPLIDAVTVMYG